MRTDLISIAAVLVILTGPTGRAGAPLSGLPARPPNTTCLAPDPPAPVASINLALENIFNGQGFTSTTSAVPSPTDPGRWYLTLKGENWRPDDIGLLFTVLDNPGSSPSITTLLDLSDVVEISSEAGVLGIALHPDFANNGHAYVSFTAGPIVAGTVLTLYVNRYTSFDGGLTLDRQSELNLLAVPQPDRHHQGGSVAFGPDGYLYVSLGEGSNPYGNPNAQDTSTILGGIVRLDVDGGTPYAIPPDNPFASGGGAPELYAWGLRNPWSFHFDRGTGELWAGDVGSTVREEINLIEKGGNYGWPPLEGSVCLGSGCNNPSFISPVVEHVHYSLPGGEMRTAIAGFVYRGSAIPELEGTLIYGDTLSNIWGLFHDELGAPSPELLISGVGAIRNFAEDADGEIIALRDGALARIVRAEPAPPTDFPQTLADTGCFDSLSPLVPASGVIPFDVNMPLWSDGAAKQRWLALPDGETIEILANGDWDLPEGTVLIKNFSIDDQLIETRFLIHHDDGRWAGYTYEWNEEQTAATLLPAGKARLLAGGQTWSYPSRPQCLGCHTEAASRALGPKTTQMNRDFLYPSTGLLASQLATLDAIGMFDEPLGSPASDHPALPDLLDGTVQAGVRAKAYMDANCANCHQPGGPTVAAIDLRFEAPMTLCNVAPDLGDLGVSGATLVTPGAPESSVLSLRAHALGLGAMPPLAKSLVDAQGTSVIDAWIGSADPCDVDLDGHADVVDNCMNAGNPEQDDDDMDGLGNVCDPDDDGDGWTDTLDNCPVDFNEDQDDRDVDLIGDSCDLCADHASADNADSDGNGIGNACECGDQNGDGRVDIVDILAIVSAIFGQETASPLCDTNEDALCNVSDILGVNAKIFGAPAYCAEYPSP